MLTIILSVSCQSDQAGGDKAGIGQEVGQDSLKEDNAAQDGAMLIDSLSRLIAQDSTNAELYGHRAKAHYRQQNIKQAIADMEQALALDKEEMDYYLALAEYYMTLGQSGRARETLEKMLLLYPDQPDGLIMMAEIFFFTKQYREAMTYLNHVQEVNPYKPKTYYVKGLMYKETGDTAKAIEQMQKALEYDPDYYAACLDLGRLYQYSDPNASAAYYERAKKIAPLSIEVRHHLAQLYQAYGKYQAALDEYRGLLAEVDSTYTEAHYNMGYIYLVELGRYDQAISSFSKAIEQEADYYQAYYNRGLAHEQKGLKSKARQDYEQALRIKNDFRPAIDGLSRLK